MKQVEVVRAVHEPGLPVRCPVVHSFCNLVPRPFSFVKKRKSPGNKVDSSFSFYRIVHPDRAFCLERVSIFTNFCLKRGVFIGIGPGLAEANVFSVDGT